MARYGIIADIHGNQEALSAVLAGLDARGVQAVLCLGDVVGFNADSDACVALVRERSIETVAGNHDLIATGRLGFERCSSQAAHALRRTRRTLTPGSRQFLSQLAPARVYEGKFLVVHGGIGDAQEYLRTRRAAADNWGRLRRSYPGVSRCFFGHTHEPALYAVTAEGVVEEPGLRPCVALDPAWAYFINPGSVDAARKRGERLAQFAVYDSSADSLAFASVPYDHAGAERKAARGGYRLGPFALWLARAVRRVRRRRP